MHHRKKANIMLLILFVMFVSSLLGLLMSQYVSSLIRVSKLFHNYYKGYYFAYAGLELGLAQSLEHGYGFEEVHSYSDFSGCLNIASCRFDVDISARQHVQTDSSTAYTNCAVARTWSAYYTISSGDGLIIPLFRDIATGFNAITYATVDDIDLVNMDPTLYNDGTTGNIYTVTIIDEDLTNDATSQSAEINTPDPYVIAPDLSGYVSTSGNKNYLVIANSTGNTMEFCLELNPGYPALPSKYIVIDSIGYYGNSTISLGAIKANQLPSYLIYSAIE